MTNALTGIAAGVPYVLRPPRGRDPHAPVVLAWHLHDAPRTEASFEAALPLAALDAWRIYLGLPNSGSRLPKGSHEEFQRLGYEDAVMNLYGPTAEQAVAESVPALDALRAELGIAAGPVGLLGGSMGSAVVLQALADGALDAAAAVVVSPVAQLRPLVTVVGRHYGMTYPWSKPSLAVASRMDYVARAAAIAAHCPAVRLVVGADDDAEAIGRPSAALAAELTAHGATSDLQTVAGMAHTLAADPGDDPAPQLPHAAVVDDLASRWFAAHLRTGN